MKILEKILYFPFGNNLFVGPGIKKDIEFLKKILPEEFKRKELFDLGCGDGKITLLLKKVFLPKKIYGCDLYPFLVKRAKKRGISAFVLDLEKEVPEGELAVMWGVLHHLKERERILFEIKKKFSYFFLREPKKEFFSFFELGEKEKEENLRNILKKVFKKGKFFSSNTSLFFFWKKC